MIMMTGDNEKPIAFSLKNSETFLGHMIYRDHYSHVKKLHIFLSKHDSNFINRRCLSSYRCPNFL